MVNKIRLSFLTCVLVAFASIADAERPGGPVDLIVVASANDSSQMGPVDIPEAFAGHEVLIWTGPEVSDAGKAEAISEGWTNLAERGSASLTFELGLARTILASLDPPLAGPKRLAIVRVPFEGANPRERDVVAHRERKQDELVNQTVAAVAAAREAGINLRFSALIWMEASGSVAAADAAATGLRNKLDAPQMAVLYGFLSASEATAGRDLASKDRRFVCVDTSSAPARAGIQTPAELGRHCAIAWLNLKARTGPWWTPTEPEDPIASLETGHSASRLAAPVSLPFRRILPGPVEDWVLLIARGDDNREYLLETRPLTAEGFRYSQRSGRSANGLKPWWLIANRRTNQGLGVMLAYMGNWSFEISPHGADEIEVRLATSPDGLTPFAMFEGLPVPGALVSEFTGHWDYGAQPITRFIREKLLRDLGQEWPLVEYNCWYGSGKGNYSEDQLIAEARKAAELGFEVVVIDAGWYGEGPGRGWGRNLGDWRVNRAVFPNGMETLAEEVRRLGMKFGIWFEIECANPKVPVATENPDWILADAGGRPLSSKPNTRIVLDLNNPDAMAHVERVLDETITRFQIEYIKLDFNTHPEIDNEKLDQSSDPLYGHYDGLARLLARLRERHPAVIIENCASGSMRHELSAAALSDTHWISDDTRNITNLQMSFGATWLFPPATCLHWTVQPTHGNPLIDLDAQFAINTMGHFGVSSRLQDWDEQTVAAFKKRVAQYKRYRPLIQKADVYHLTPQRLGITQAALYLDSGGGNALLFAFQGGAEDLNPTIRLRGLDPSRRYRIGGDIGDQIASGADLIRKGLGLSFPGSGAALIVTLDPVSE